MIEEYIEKSWTMLKEFPRVTPLLIARRFKLDLAFAQKVCHAVWLRQHKEARELAKNLENSGFPSQLQIAAGRKNLKKFKGKKRWIIDFKKA